MVDRPKNSHIEVLKVLNYLVSDLTTQRIMINFEIAFISVFKDEFPTTDIRYKLGKLGDNFAIMRSSIYYYIIIIVIYI